MIDDILRGIPEQKDIEVFKTEKLISELKKLGISYTKKGFEPILLKYRYSTEDLINVEFKNIMEDYGDKEFFTILYCIRELRKRHFPNMTNMDQIEDLMQDGYTEIHDNLEVIKGVEKWISAWEIMKDLVPQDITSLEEVNNISYTLTQSIHNWCQDLVAHLAVAAMRQKKYYHEIIKFTHEFISKFPDSSSNIIIEMKMDHAEAHYELGKFRTLNILLKEVYQEFPENVWMYIRISDILLQLAKKTTKAKYIDKAEKLLTRARKRAKDQFENEAVEDRYENIKNDRQLLFQKFNKSNKSKEAELAKQIVKQLPKYLPIEAKLEINTAELLKKRMKSSKRVNKCQIKSIIDSGEEGGIICDITFGKDPILVSLSHLILEKSSPMYTIMREYQKLRISNLQDISEIDGN